MRREEQPFLERTVPTSLQITRCWFGIDGDVPHRLAVLDQPRGLHREVLAVATARRAVYSNFELSIFIVSIGNVLV